MSSALDILATPGVTRPVPLFVHAHPDDETLQTGPLLAWLATQGISSRVVTCTRGEQGEIVAGVLPRSITGGDLVRVRNRELACAIDALQVAAHYFLGRPPARADALAERHYHDSGMVWVAEGLAGPAETSDPDAFSLAPLDDEVADLVALVRRTEPSVLVGYDRLGSYGHPDHLRAHELTKAASAATGVPMVEVASTPGAEGFEWFDFADQLGAVTTALQCHASQLTVQGDHLVHVGGQHQDLPRLVGLRRVPQD